MLRKVPGVLATEPLHPTDVVVAAPANNE